MACRHTVCHGVGVGYGKAGGIKRCVQLGVVGSKIYQSTAFLSYQIVYCRIVVAFVLSSQNQYSRSVDGLQGNVAGVDIGGFGVVDIGDSVFYSDFFQTVLNAGEIFETLSDCFVVNSHCFTCEVGGQGVASVVYAWL